MSGSVITRENPIYKKVKDIDIFNLKAFSEVKELEMEIVSAADPSKPLFTQEEIDIGESIPENIKRERESARKAQEAKKEVVLPQTEVVEVEKDELEELNKKIATLENEKINLQDELLKRKKEIEELKKSHRSEGYSRGHAEGISKGIADGRKKVEECCSSIKNEIENIHTKVEEENKLIENDVIELVSFLFEKILNMSDKNEMASSLMSQIKNSFPRESRIILKCSKDMAELFSQEKDILFEIRVDSAMKEGSIFVETSEIVADFSVKNQLSKMIAKLKEEVYV